MILYISIWAAVILTGLSLAALALFGLRNLTYGKVETISIAAVALPGVILLILRGTMGAWAEAGITTLIVMFVLSMLGLVYSGITNLFW